MPEWPFLNPPSETGWGPVRSGSWGARMLVNLIRAAADPQESDATPVKAWPASLEKAGKHTRGRTATSSSSHTAKARNIQRGSGSEGPGPIRLHCLSAVKRGPPRRPRLRGPCPSHTAARRSRSPLPESSALHTFDHVGPHSCPPIRNTPPSGSLDLSSVRKWRNKILSSDGRLK